MNTPRHILSGFLPGSARALACAARRPRRAVRWSGAAALLRSAGAPTATCGGACAPQTGNPPPVFQTLENQTTTFSKHWTCPANGGEISRKLFHASENFTPIFPSLGKNTASRFQGLRNCQWVAIALLASLAYGCGSSQLHEQQCADRFNALMENWYDELLAHANSFDQQHKLTMEEFLKTRSIEVKEKRRALLIEDIRTAGNIHIKYANLLACEHPTVTLLVPYEKTQKMFRLLGEGCLKCAQLQEAGNSKAATEILEAKTRESQKCAIDLAQWVKPYSSRVASKLFAMATNDFSATTPTNSALKK